jgi:hypothetical protein
VDQRRHPPPRTSPFLYPLTRAHALLPRAQPQAEDSPNTRTNTAASSFFLTPLNYFDADVSLESRNAVLLTHPKVAGDPFEFDEYGVVQVRRPSPTRRAGGLIVRAQARPARARAVLVPGIAGGRPRREARARGRDGAAAQGGGALPPHPD